MLPVVNCRVQEYTPNFYDLSSDSGVLCLMEKIPSALWKLWGFWEQVILSCKFLVTLFDAKIHFLLWHLLDETVFLSLTTATAQVWQKPKMPHRHSFEKGAYYEQSEQVFERGHTTFDYTHSVRRCHFPLIFLVFSLLFVFWLSCPLISLHLIREFSISLWFPHPHDASLSFFSQWLPTPYRVS